jgi:hypothetical protein
MQDRKFIKFLRKNKDRFSTIFNPAVKVHVSPWMGVLGGGLFILSLMGIRNVIFTPNIVKLLGNNLIEPWLDFVYLIGIIISLMIVMAYLINKPTDLTLEDLKELGVYLLLVIPFLSLVFTQRLFLDFWLDELISIVRHIQPSVREAILYYPVPNNHIFSNLLTAVYIQVIGKQEMREILSSPVILRLPYLFSSIISLYVLGLTAKKHIHKLAGFVSVILLSTTIPFLNFAVQVRGYSFTILFSSLLLFTILQYLEKPTRWRSTGICIYTCLLVYTVPSNIYFVFSLIIYFILVNLLGVPNSLRANKENYKKNIYQVIDDLKPVLFLVGGIILSVLLYAPLISSMTSDTYMRSEGLFRGSVFQSVFQNTLVHLVSKRWVLLILGMVGIGSVIINEEEVTGKKHLVGVLSSAIFLPFLLSFIRGDKPFERVFLVILPAFIMFLSMGIIEVYKYIRKYFSDNSLLPQVYISLIFIIANIIFGVTYQDIKSEIKQYLIAQEFDYVEFRDNRMWASHFLEYYRVMDLIDFIEESEGFYLVYLDKNNTRYSWVVSTYFDCFGIDYIEFEESKEIEGNKVLMVMSYPDRSLEDIYIYYPESSCYNPSNVLSLYQARLCDIK